MNKSYKMVLLKYMLSKGPERWLEPIRAEEAVPFFHQYLMEKEYRFNTDFSDAKGKQLRKYDKKKIASLIADMPMTKWSGSAKDNLVVFEDKNAFSFDLAPVAEEMELLYNWTAEIAGYRLHAYFERKVSSYSLN